LQARPRTSDIRTSNQHIRKKKNFPKKDCLEYLEKEKEPKICMGATQRNLQAQPKILKKIFKHQINQPE
jgi:hypothetical protein